MADEIVDLGDDEVLEPSPDETEPSNEESPAGDPADSDLAKQLNLESLPDDPAMLKDAVLQRVHELREGLRQAQEASATVRKQYQEDLTKMVEAIGKSHQPEAPPPSSIPTWVKNYKAPPGIKDEGEILADFIAYAIKQEVGPKLNQIDALGMAHAESMVAAAKAKYADWAEIEPKVTGALTAHPTFGLDDAVRFVRAEKLDESVDKLAQRKMNAKRQSAGTLANVGVARAASKEPDPRSTDEGSFYTWALGEAKRELGWGNT